MGIIHKHFENDQVKITVEENGRFSYIATAWDKYDVQEFEREVHTFHSLSEAVSEAFDLLTSYLRYEEKVEVRIRHECDEKIVSRLRDSAQEIADAYEKIDNCDNYSAVGSNTKNSGGN
jgi:hypothetical protein